MKKVFLSLGALLTIVVANAQEQRVPLFEVFTSSTCGPCKPGNTVYHGVVNPKPFMQYVSVKFQHDFPGTGDPYCTNESVSRRSYYSINSIPRMEIDGGWDQNAQSFTSALYTQYRAIPAEFKLYGTYTINAATKTVNSTVKYAPLTAAAASAAGLKIYVAILEKKTTQNKKPNGELEFESVMKKMLPDQNGTALTGLTLNTEQTKTFNYTFNGNFRLPTNGQTANRINHTTEHSVEEFTDLHVVAWIQDGAKKVYQAANLAIPSPTTVGEVAGSIGSYTLYPNPSATVANIDVNMKAADEVTASIVSLSGAVVAQKEVRLNAGHNQVPFDTQDLPNGQYTVILLDTKGSVFVDRLTVLH